MVNKKVSVIKKDLKHELKNEVTEIKNGLKSDMKCQSLKNQAFNIRNNLVITGLKADNQKSDFEVVADFLPIILGTGDTSFIAASKLGSQPEEDSNYIRPIMVKFRDVERRNKVWRKRTEITSEDGCNKIRIQSDLPKPLREGLQVMERVVKAASKFPEFAAAKINNYQLEVNDKIYQISDLENLQKQI